MDIENKKNTEYDKLLMLMLMLMLYTQRTLREHMLERTQTCYVSFELTFDFMFGLFIVSN